MKIVTSEYKKTGALRLETAAVAVMQNAIAFGTAEKMPLRIPFYAETTALPE